ncbi:hypothetical protein [Streptosporangium sp. NPDC023615]|uniref:hypothetical protein n=1 Tax=Streptosporangium sp. NPDC023615 TaxID=3154794 RepID=UPI003425201D
MRQRMPPPGPKGVHGWDELYERLADLHAWADQPKHGTLRELVPELTAPWQVFGDKRLARPSRELVLSGVRACLLAGGVVPNEVDRKVDAWADACWRIQRSEDTSRRAANITLEVVFALLPIAIAVVVNIATEYKTNSFVWALVIIASGLSALITHRLRTREWIRKPLRVTAGIAATVLLAGSVAFELHRSTPVATSGPALTARVLGVGRESSLQGSDWVFRDKKMFTPAQAREVAGLEGDAPAMRARGAVDPLLLPVSIILVGTTKRGVTVTGMWLKSQCSRPLTGTLLHRQPGAGPRENARFSFDLDSPNPRAQVYAPIGAKSPDYFHGELAKSIFLADGEQQVISMEARTLRSSCVFEIIVEYTTGGPLKSLPVDRGGFTLAVTAYADGAKSSVALRDTSAYARYYVYSDTGDPTLIPRG